MSDPLTRRGDDPLTTPDPTGLREAVAEHLHERFAADHEPHWHELDESEQTDSLYADMARSLFEPGAVLAAHPTPDASPDPAVVQALADVIAEHREDGSYPDTCLCEVEANPQAAPGHFSRHLAAIVANHVAATREADRPEFIALHAQHIAREFARE